MPGATGPRTNSGGFRFFTLACTWPPMDRSSPLERNRNSTATNPRVSVCGPKLSPPASGWIAESKSLTYRHGKDRISRLGVVQTTSEDRVRTGYIRLALDTLL